MSVALEQPQVIGGMREGRVQEAPSKAWLTPGMVALLSAPVTVLLTMLAACGVLTAAGMAIHQGEMIGGAIVNVIGGVAASIPLFILMKKGTAAIAQAGILGIALRVGTVLLALLVAGIGALGLERIILVYWVMAYYFPMLIVETAVVAWLSIKAKD